MFTLNIYSTDRPPQSVAITMAIHGRLLESMPGTLLISVNGRERKARWTGDRLVFERPVAVRFDIRTIRILDGLSSGELPHSAQAALELASSAGVEAGVERCELCGSVVPAVRAEVHALCACPKCVESRGLGLISQDPPF